MSQLEDIIQAGDDPLDESRPSNKIRCADGFTCSVIAHWGAHCMPRPPSNPPRAVVPCGPFTHVEVGYPSIRPEPWAPIDGDLYWRRFAEDPDQPTGTMYGYVPVSLVRHLIRSHGGEA